MQTVGDQTSQLRQANDILRSSMLTGNIFSNDRFDALPLAVRSALLMLVRKTRQFDADTAETHASGLVQLQKLQLRWRILYYDATLKNPSRDPSDPHRTRRVLKLNLL